MKKKNFMKGCMNAQAKKGKSYEESKHSCEVSWDKHKSETAPIAELGFGKARYKTNDRRIKIIILIIFLLILGAGIFFSMNFLN